MTLDSTWQNHKTLATRLGLEHQWLGTWLGLEPSDLRWLDNLIQRSPTRRSRDAARRADSRRGEQNLQPLLLLLWIHAGRGGTSSSWATMRPIICEDTLGSYHYVKEGWGADAPKTAGVVVQASYRATGRRGAGFKCTRVGKSQEICENRKKKQHLAACQWYWRKQSWV